MLNTPGAAQPSLLSQTSGPYSELSDDGDSASKALFKALSAEHPDYMAWKDRWRVYRDVVDDAYFQKEVYLYRNEREHQDQYEFRLQIAEFLPDTPTYVERLIGALYNEKPKRDLTAHPDLVEFSRSVTLSKRSSLSSMDAFMQRTMRALITWGTIRIVVTSKSSAPGTTRAQEKAAGVRPYLVLYNPLSVIDWDEDETGELTMARTCERYCRKVNPEDPYSEHVQYVRFIQYDRQMAHWWVFSEDQDDREKWMLEDEGEAKHDLGVVPMIVYYWPNVHKCMVGQSFLRYMARAELSKFRSDSDLDYDAHMHAHPALCLKTNEKVRGEVIIGGGRYIRLQPGTREEEGEDAFYLQYPTPALDALKDVIKSKQRSIKRYASVDPAGALEDQPLLPPSGVSRAWSFGTSEARILSSLADAAADIEAEIFEMVLRYYGEQPRGEEDKVFKGEVQYPEDFDLAASGELLEESERAGASINSPTLIKYMHKRYARTKAGDAGQDLLKKIDQEIDDNPILAEAIRPPAADLLGFPKVRGEESSESSSSSTSRPPRRAPS